MHHLSVGVHMRKMNIIVVNNSSTKFLDDGLLISGDRMVFVLSKGMFGEYVEKNE